MIKWSQVRKAGRRALVLLALIGVAGLANSVQFSPADAASAPPVATSAGAGVSVEHAAALNTVIWGNTQSWCYGATANCFGSAAWLQRSGSYIQAGIDGWCYYRGTTLGRQKCSSISHARVDLQYWNGITLRALNGGPCSGTCPTTYRITTQYGPYSAQAYWRSHGFAVSSWLVHFNGAALNVYPTSDWLVLAA